LFLVKAVNMNIPQQLAAREVLLTQEMLLGKQGGGDEVHSWV